MEHPQAKGAYCYNTTNLKLYLIINNNEVLQQMMVKEIFQY
jgi:hypothetical protein